ncbi:hypothetical protein GCM10027299_55970 [Larkinella ripae]
MESTTQTSNLKLLDVLVGKWNTTGQVRATSSTPASTIIGTDNYEWILNNLFLLHRVDVQIGQQKVEAIELIGDDGTNGQTYAMRSFDNQGKFATMEAQRNQDGTFTFTGESERTTLTIHEGGHHMEAHWERLADNSTWVAWMDLNLIRAT